MREIEVTPGLKLVSSEFIRAIIDDMRAADADPSMKLDMETFAVPGRQGCMVCAGGAVVLNRLGGDRYYRNWTPEQREIADWCDDVRRAQFLLTGVPRLVQCAHAAQ